MTVTDVPPHQADCCPSHQPHGDPPRRRSSHPLRHSARPAKYPPWDDRLGPPTIVPRGGYQVRRFGYVLVMAAAHLSKVSRLLHAIDDWTSKAWIAGTLSIAGVLALVAAFVTGLSSPAVTVVTAVMQVVTLILIFAVQHTQARDQRATHRKLDELIATIPATDRRFIRLEQATDDEINNSVHGHRERRTGE